VLVKVLSKWRADEHFGERNDALQSLPALPRSTAVRDAQAAHLPPFSHHP